MIQVYTGNGKGKTTAALGLALRAAGAGLKVYIAQFAKGKIYSEHQALKKIKNIKVEQFGRSCFIKCAPQECDMQLALAGIKKARQALTCGKYQMVILDEVNLAVKLKLLALKELLGLFNLLAQNTELVLTGRYAHPEIIKRADLVSEIKEVKHYYKRGVKARKGIEL